MMSEAVIVPQKAWPRWANKLVVFFGVPTGILLAVVAFFGAMEQFGGQMKPICEAMGICVAAKPSPPSIPNYQSPWVDGGHNTAEFCEPQAQHYRQIHPDFNITWRALGEGRNKDWIGHATYQYNCAFEAAAK